MAGSSERGARGKECLEKKGLTGSTGLTGFEVFREAIWQVEFRPEIEPETKIS